MKSPVIVSLIAVIIVAAGAILITSKYNGNKAEDGTVPASTSSQTETGSEVNTTNPIRPATGTAAAVETKETGIVVSYTNDGFRPIVLTVTQGTSVLFRNDSNRALRITSDTYENLSKISYRGFEQSRSIKKGETFNFTFNDKGIWAYKNLNEPAHVGIIVVNEKK